MVAYEVWDRQPGESAKAYALFAQYRDAGPLERTHSKVAREFGRTLHTVHEIAVRNNWTARAAAWDAENERVKRNAQIKELEALSRRQVLAGTLFMSKGLKRIQAMTDDEVQMLSVWEAIRLVESGVRLTRLGLGESEPSQTFFQQNVIVGGDIPIIELLRRNPTRVGPVVEALVEVQKHLPELAAGGAVYYDEGREAEMADLLGDENGDSGDEE